ncbi:MAG: hypothetical protein KKE83_07010 [Proteobacteria bacterium]|nr:hypothetical protein [Pseudomonadota bacterium]MBU1545983.1 hypothetical protein [Pseudomonadota bacterium]MBU2619421.1 hypothetical protein [Pseudomonadota bacterium]
MLSSKIVNSIGLLFDIAGAWLVAWEVVRQYKGDQFKTQMFDDIGDSLARSSDYEGWESNKYLKMKFGLFGLTIGFLLQIASNWL